MDAVAEENDSQIDSKKKGPPTTSSAHLFGKWFSWLFFAALGVGTSFFAYEYLLNRVDREICVQVQKRIQEQFPQCHVSVGRAHLDPGRGIIVEDISLAIPSKQGLEQAVFIRRLNGFGVIDLPDLLSDRIPVKHWDVTGLELSLWKEKGRWAIQEIIPKEFRSTNPFELTISEGTVRLRELSLIHI